MLHYFPMQFHEVSSPVQNSSLFKEKHIENYSYNLSALLGEGSYSHVFKGLDNSTQTPVAIKVVDRKKIHNPYVLKMIQQETLIMGHLNHPNIVRVFEVVNTVNNIYIIQEFCDGGDISNEVQNRKFPENEVVLILKDILTALLVLKSNGIMHRDLKPANIFLNDGVYKLGDFGFARLIDCSEEPLETFLVGTPLYMSPQCLQGIGYTEKNDMWSLGITIYELISGEVPYFCNSHPELLHAIYTRKVKYPKGISPWLKKFIAKCLMIEETRRMSLEEALETVNGWNLQEEKNKSEEQSTERKPSHKYDEITNNLEETVRKYSNNALEEKKINDFEKFDKIIEVGRKKNEVLKSRHRNSSSWGESDFKSMEQKNELSGYIPKNENERVSMLHLKYAEFIENLKDQVNITIDSKILTEKEAIKLKILIYRSWMTHLQKILVIFRDKYNMFFLEKWEEFTKSQKFCEMYEQLQKIYDKAIQSYKDFVTDLYSKMDTLKEITAEEKINDTLVNNNVSNHAFYALLLKEIKQFIREINHAMFEKLCLSPENFNKTQAKFLNMLIRFYESLLKITKNGDEIPKIIELGQSGEVDTNLEFYCLFMRAKIYEMNI